MSDSVGPYSQTIITSASQPLIINPNAPGGHGGSTYVNVDMSKLEHAFNSAATSIGDVQLGILNQMQKNTNAIKTLGESLNQVNVKIGDVQLGAKIVPNRL
jgi:hypothetical protein